MGLRSGKPPAVTAMLWFDYLVLRTQKFFSFLAQVVSGYKYLTGLDFVTIPFLVERLLFWYGTIAREILYDM